MRNSAAAAEQGALKARDYTRENTEDAHMERDSLNYYRQDLEIARNLATASSQAAQKATAGSTIAANFAAAAAQSAEGAKCAAGVKLKATKSCDDNWAIRRWKMKIGEMEYSDDPDDTPELMEFAEKLVKLVRDTAIETCQAKWGNPYAPEWKRWDMAQSREELVRLVIADAVDVTIMNLLEAMDDDEILLSYQAESGAVQGLAAVDHTGKCPCYRGTDEFAWRNQFSTYPVQSFDPLNYNPHRPA